MDLKTILKIIIALGVLGYGRLKLLVWLGYMSPETQEKILKCFFTPMSPETRAKLEAEFQRLQKLKEEDPSAYNFEMTKKKAIAEALKPHRPKKPPFQSSLEEEKFDLLDTIKGILKLDRDVRLSESNDDGECLINVDGPKVSLEEVADKFFEQSNYMGIGTLGSPLEQFNVEIIYPISIRKLDLSLTYINVYLLIGSIFIFSVLYYMIRNGKLVPKFWQSVGEISVLRIADLAVQQAGYKAKKYIQIFFVIFFFILGLNVIGLIPMGFTATRHILITLGLSFRLNLGLLILGFFYHGMHFLKLFVPSDAPKPLLPLIVIIELVRYIIRPFSLAIRLFANMMAGHTLLFILSGFVLAFLKSPFFMFAIFPLILVFAIVGLEVGISFLQAYVFTVLFAIYSNDALNLH